MRIKLVSIFFLFSFIFIDEVKADRAADSILVANNRDYIYRYVMRNMFAYHIQQLQLDTNKSSSVQYQLNQLSFLDTSTFVYADFRIETDLIYPDTNCILVKVISGISSYLLERPERPTKDPEIILGSSFPYEADTALVALNRSTRVLTMVSGYFFRDNILSLFFPTGEAQNEMIRTYINTAYYYLRPYDVRKDSKDSWMFESKVNRLQIEEKYHFELCYSEKEHCWHEKLSIAR